MSVHLSHIDVWISTWRLEPHVVCTTFSALNTPMNDVARNKIPREAVVRLTRLLWCPPWMSISQRPTNHTQARAEKSTLFCHYSPPQQIGQRPFLCIGLHLSLVSPQMRASIGAMCRNCSPGAGQEANSVAVAAYLTND